MEVNKALLVASGHHLYAEIWNDQPPLYTLFLSALFDSGMVEMLWLRRANCIFTVFLFVATCAVGGMLGLSVAELLSAGGFLTTSFAFLPCSASATLEIPALSLGMLGTWGLLLAISRSSIVWGVVAGSLFGVAAMLKLTGLSVLPLAGGFVAVAWLARQPRCVCVSAAALFASAVTAVVIWWSCTGGASWHYLVFTHFAGYPAVDAEASAAYRFRWTWFSSQPFFTVAAAIGGIYLALSSRKWTAALVGVWATSILLAFAAHFPWWNYYSIHLSIPMALLAGVGLVGGIRWIISTRGGGALQAGFKLLAAALAAAGVWEWGEAFAAEAARVRAEGPWQDNPIVQCVRKHVPNAHGQRTMLQLVPDPYAAYCRLQPLPWYAVMPLKRYWIGDLTDDELAEHIRAQKADVLIAPALDRARPTLVEAIRVSYQPLCGDEDIGVWVPRTQ